MPIDPLTDTRFATRMFSDDERQFLAWAFTTYPHIGENFVRYLDMPPGQRLDKAREALKHVPRTGWVNFKVERPETIYDHLEGLATMLGNYLRGKNASPLQRIYMEEMAWAHDLPEAIATDFTIHDGISKQDKEQLEWLAAKVLFEAPQNARNLDMVREYMDQQTYESRLLHDFDKIHAVRGALYFQSLTDEPVRVNGKTMWEEFYPSVVHKVKTEEGKAYLADVAANREAHTAQFKALHQAARSR